ncbi:MAG: serine/threonine protein kinase [Acidobacteria bacterium]|nr:serine/threonine protein kinase [Acidobacteriota bacterium]
MPEIGHSLSHYSIVEKIGKGGMGEVYRAKDQVLGRDVAIKVLPEEFAKDADRVARFQREAKLLASLNHPNIAAIYGLEASDQTNFLVLELVEGQTLADRLKSGPIPVEEALKLALQIVEALEAAHEKGVIHRDLKPANIKVTPDGKAKVLDFGLAKAYAGDQEANLSNSPTLSNMATQQGIILGTAAYMAPEQAKGKTVDRRADIWAFGAVLFEMLTGKPAFPGEEVTEILASVIKGDSSLNLLPENLHPRVREAITRCLQKDARRRYSSITDARYEIEQALLDPSGVLARPAAVAKARKKLRLGLPWVAAIAMLCLLIAGVAAWKLKPSEPRRTVRFDHDLPAGQQFTQLNRQLLAVSPDGSQFVYSTTAGLYLRSLEQTTARLIPGTDQNSRQPVFSPDGKWICYFSAGENQLKKIAVSGGAPVTLCSIQGSPRRLTWSVEDTIVFSSAGGIMRISPNGGTPELLIKARLNDVGEAQILPGGKAVLFTLGAGDLRRIAVQSLKSGERKELFAGDSARYLPTGHIVYSLKSVLFAIPFDVDKLETRGGPVSMVEGVLKMPGIVAQSQYAFSGSGVLVYVPGAAGDVAAKRTLVWVDRKGKEEPLPAAPNDYRVPRISPDGTKVALTINSGERSDIWIWDLVRGTMPRLTFNEVSSYPLWTTDGKRIAFAKRPTNLGSEVYWKAADGTGEEEKIGSAPNRGHLPWSWSSDGQTLALFEFALSGETGYDIGTLSTKGNHEWKPLLNQKHTEFQPKISPDGRWIAYASDESGKLEIYGRPYPEVNKGRWQVSTSGGHTPLWSPNGRELFYLNEDAVMRVPVETEPAFSAGKPETLFRGAYVRFSTSDGQPWDISPDGKRFLMMKEPEAVAPGGGGPNKVNIVLNWFEELKQRVPVK